MLKLIKDNLIMPNLKAFYQKQAKNTIRCLACSHHCLIHKSEKGICGVRENNKGKLKLLVKGKAVGMHLDPIEKKPLFHFLPGETALSFGTLGCNFSCQFCQNWTQSQSPKQTDNVPKLIEKISHNYSPKEIVDLALEFKSPTIAYTYNEPTIFIEYALETMTLAKEAGLKNVWVSNGFMSRQTRKALASKLDGINIDLKSFNPDFYHQICGAKIEPVLDNIKWLWKKGVWVEVTTLIIPDKNDSPSELKKIANFLKDISSNLPWHITPFYPSYKMLNKPRTPAEKLLEAWQIGKKAGLNFVYPGNIINEEHASTHCSKCGQLLIKRSAIGVRVTSNFKNGSCQKCSQKIPGIWRR